MDLSINGQSQVPPGFRFHPTEEELLHYYLRKKVANHEIDLNVIPEVDLNKLEPWDIQEKCKIGSTPQNDWYFFSHKDKKYPTGTRTNRATTAGFWKATGRDKIIYSGCTRIGLRKTLVFYTGRAPHGQKSDWIMHEYRLDETTVAVEDSNVQEEGWVVCRVFKKRNYQKALEGGPRSCSTTSIESKIRHMLSSSGDGGGVLDQILLYMGRSCKMESEPFVSGNSINMQERFMHLPKLQDSPTLSSQLPMITTSPSSLAAPLIINQDGFRSCNDQSMNEIMDDEQEPEKRSLNHWAVLDKLVASQLNGQEADTTLKQQRTDPQSSEPSQVAANNYNSLSESDFWGFTKSLWSSSSLDPLCHLSV